MRQTGKKKVKMQDGRRKEENLKLIIKERAQTIDKAEGRMRIIP